MTLRMMLAVLIVSGLSLQPSAGAGKETVLFPFDDYSVPFIKGLVLELVPGRKSKVNQGTGADPLHPNRLIVSPGQPGDPDHPRVYYYGTVLKIDGEYRMWYTGWDKEKKRQVLYAVSRDGINWDKPALGLVEYNGDRQNNLVLSNGDGPMKGAYVLVLHEPEDPDPNRRFKMVREEHPRAIMAAYSPDGLRWTDSPNNPIIKSSGMEPGGLIRFNGFYYLNGQGGPIPHPVPKARNRIMVTYVSHDFDHWSDAAHLSFRRDPIPPRPLIEFEIHRGAQVHMGASLWNRGNVIVGFYGQYDNQTNDRRYSTCDLGLVVSHDAIHFKEPIPDFKIVPSYEEADGAEPRLIQGQGFENIGDRTFFWYSIWVALDPEGPTGVRLATWDRDRLGYFTAAPRTEGAHFLSTPIELDSPRAEIYVNAGGLSDNSQLRVEVLDDRFQPLPGYSGDTSISLRESGLRQRVTWRGKEHLEGVEGPFRIRVNWEGIRPEDARLYAVYVVEKD